MRTIGKSRNALLKFCSIMDLPTPINYKPFKKHTEALKEASEKTCRDKMIESAEELKIIKRDSSEWDGEGPCKCAVSVDGSWSHVGYSARNGFVSVISVDTGKVLDYVTVSNECKGCKQWERERKTSTREFLSWFVEHDKVCTLNHEGSAKTMEAKGAVMLFRRSQDFNGLQYTTFVGDGYSSAFGSVIDSHPYGPTIIIQKEDCVGHIQGRMGKHLKRLVDQNKEGESSWCKWQVDKVSGTRNYLPLKNPLSPVLVEMIKPVFDKLSSLQLLKGAEKCLTQNQNESLHHVIWSYLPKGEYHSPTETLLGVALAVGHFNDGMVNFNTQLFHEINLKVGINKSIWAAIDNTRLRHAAYKHSDNVKQRRKDLKAMEAAKLDSLQYDDSYSKEQYYSKDVPLNNRNARDDQGDWFHHHFPELGALITSQEWEKTRRSLQDVISTARLTGCSNYTLFNMPSENCQQLDRLASVRSGLSSIYRNYDFHLSLVKMTGSVVLLSLLSASLVLTNSMYQIEKANVRNRSECITSQAPEDTQTQSNNTLCSYLKPFQLPGEYFVTVCLY
ncbi:unnamed protein product [Mytilus coruscus]|uniref:Mutator-like transposase domain-containing protein n=1 Tax=Mytilus coruscus TaxID=42192 RepID=A0A6J8AIB3_MYTCO|nr:unnamed protein product [Mytilus coruscus]